MLVLSRKVGQRIRLGDGIVVTVLDLRGGQVRLGIEAPEDVVVLRDEIHDQWRESAPPTRRPAKTR
jgi:carbon storage regulator